MAKQLLLVGSYNHLPFGSGEGIYVLDYDTETGEWGEEFSITQEEILEM